MQLLLMNEQILAKFQVNMHNFSFAKSCVASASQLLAFIVPKLKRVNA
jgi:hypothetical protein